MSVLIHDMEMPQSCDDCRLNNGISCYAVPEYTEDGVVGRTEDRPDWCPLVPVPPHGRLGDLDELLDKVIAKYLKHERMNQLVFAAAEIKQDMCDFISDAPTIIPAEEGE